MNKGYNVSLQVVCLKFCKKYLNTIDNLPPSLSRCPVAPDASALSLKKRMCIYTCVWEICKQIEIVYTFLRDLLNELLKQFPKACHLQSWLG